MKVGLFASLAAGVAASTLSVVQAATITACGPTVCYQYDNGQAAVAYVGTPTLVGDDMEFLPPGFTATSSGAGFVISGPANFVFSRVWTPGGQEITALNVYEEGDYRILNGGDVYVDLYVQARSNVLSSDGLSNTFGFEAHGASGGLQVWSLSGQIAPAASFSAAANDMRISVQNTLIANAGAGQLATISKKFTLVTETVVPVPAAVWLLGSAIGLLGVMRRRTR